MTSGAIGASAPPGLAQSGSEAFAALGGWPGALGRIVAGMSLSHAEAAAVIGEVLDGAATPAQTAALLVALRMKGETVEEMRGLVDAMLAHAVPLQVDGDVVDVVGTGGDRLASINVSTLAACIAAGAGARVCKHGNRAASSSVGTADVLEALGVVVDLGPVGVARCVREVGMGFCYAPRYHPAMRHAGPVRGQLGVPTVFNFLGPLANPARARRQLVGVSDPAMAPKMAEVLGADGSVHAMIVYAEDGLDELSVTSPSSVLEIVADPSEPAGFTRRSWRLEPEELGIARSVMSELRGGDAAFNAGVIRRVLEGERSARRDIGVLNAAAALVVAGRAPGIGEGVAMASDALDTGRALAVLDGLVRVSREEAEAERDAGAQVPVEGSRLPSAAT
ncbi:MAG TPA: anthranilate phosphoribosyltransferase [Acidimicrobiales bacterium]|nr:anthranilate phosphoribosyltransferase [Acidimicrobiales bacterium]